MQQTVLYREFDEGDIDFIYKFKNNEKLNSMIVGQFRPFTYEDARKWVEGCMGEHETYKYWAICTNNDEKRIIGWCSLSKIDKTNQSASFHGLVIADKLYHDGFAWIETYCFIMKYVFEVLGFNRMYSDSIEGHKQSNIATHLFLFTIEGVLREAIIKNGKKYDIRLTSILKDEYFKNKENGEYELKSILKRLRNLKKSAK